MFKVTSEPHLSGLVSAQFGKQLFRDWGGRGSSKRVSGMCRSH